MGLLSTNQREKLIIIGRGNQALAWASNLQASGREYSLGVRDLRSSSHPQVLLGPNLSECHNFALLIPDEFHEKFFLEYGAYLPEKSRVIYAHGYSVEHQKLAEKFPKFEHLLFAPKSIASQIIENQKTGKKTAVFCSVEKTTSDHKEFLEKLATDLNFFIASYGTFREEVLADLFSEQTLLCGLYPFMIAEAFKILKDNGVNQDLSFLECWHESKLIMDTLVEKGPVDFFKMISPNALYGAMEASKTLFDDEFRNKLQSIFNNIKEGHFQKKIDEKYQIETAKEEMNNIWKNSDLQKGYEKFQGQLYQ